MTGKQLTIDFEPLPHLLTPDEMYDRFVNGSVILKFKEDRRVEIKSARISCKDIGDYLSMWANTMPDGGILVIGIENNGEVTGCHHLEANRINDIEKAGLIYCPDARASSKRIPARTAKGEDTWLIVFRVDYRADKVARTSGNKAYVRIADDKRELSADEIHELAIDRGEKAHEEEPSGLMYPGDIDLNMVQVFCDNYRRMTDAPNLPNLKILELKHLGITKNGIFTPNISCALLFARDPGSICPGCRVRFLRYQGEEEGVGEEYNVIKDQFIDGPIPYLIDETARVLDGQLRQFSRLGPDGYFYTVPEYPKPAWFEAIVNACVHRSYSLKNMTIFVKMFDDHLVIESPGSFPPLVTAENVFDMHVPRNPRLMHAMYYLNITREQNEGTKRMRKSMVDMFLPSPEFQEASAGFSKVTVTLRNNHKQRKTWVDSDVSKILGEALIGDLNTDERLIVNYVAENGSINATQCLRQVPSCAKWHTAKRKLDRLVARKILVLHQTRTRDPNSCYTFPGQIPPTRIHWRERMRG